MFVSNNQLSFGAGYSRQVLAREADIPKWCFYLIQAPKELYLAWQKQDAFTNVMCQSYLIPSIRRSYLFWFLHFKLQDIC